ALALAAQKGEPTTGGRFGGGRVHGGVSLATVAGQTRYQSRDRLCDSRPRRLLGEWHTVVTDLDHGAVVVRKLPEGLTAHRLLGLLQADNARLHANAVDDELDLLFQAFHFIERQH